MTLPLAAGHEERGTASQPNAGQGPSWILSVGLSSAFDCLGRIGIELIFSVTGEAEAGSAGEQPAEE